MHDPSYLQKGKRGTASSHRTLQLKTPKRKINRKYYTSPKRQSNPHNTLLPFFTATTILSPFSQHSSPPLSLLRTYPPGLRLRCSSHQPINQPLYPHISAPGISQESHTVHFSPFASCRCIQPSRRRLVLNHADLPVQRMIFEI